MSKKIKSSVSGSSKSRDSGTGSRKSGGKKTIRSRVSSSSKSSGPAKVTKKSTDSTPRTVERDATSDQLADVRTRWENLAGMVTLATLVDLMSNLTHTVDTLDQDVSTLRTRGYRYGRGWEDQVKALKRRWTKQERESRQLINSQRQHLQNSAYEIEELLDRAQRNSRLLPTVNDRLFALDRHISEARERIRGIFDETEEAAYTLQREIQRANFLLDSLDSASFDLYPKECGVAVVEAVWESDREEPEGFLFLTEGRLIFEQREEKATKKILFITTEKELIKEKLWEAPIGAIDEIDVEDQRAFLQRKELLTLRFNTRTRELPSDITLRLKDADNETWYALIRRVKSGQIESERFDAAQPTPDSVAEAANPEEPSAPLPTKCPNCGAQLPTIFKGMQQVTCDYCGTVTRL